MKFHAGPVVTVEQGIVVTVEQGIVVTMNDENISLRLTKYVGSISVVSLSIFN